MTHEAIHFPILKELGLSETEALIYELLLEEGPTKGSDLARKSAIGRGNVYNTLTSLIGKGLVEETNGKVAVFKALDPERLRILGKQKRVAAEALYEQLESVLPSLKSSHRLFTKQPTVRVFEGVEGLKELYGETLREKKPIFAFVSPDEPTPAILRWLTSTYVKARVDAGIQVKAIVNGESQAASYIAKSQQELREARFIKSDRYPFRGEIDVFGDKVAFIAYKEEELIGVIIESAGIAETLRSAVQIIFDTIPAPSAS